MIDLTSIYDLDHHCILVPTPCGCITPSNQQFIEGIFECKWCGATFSAQDFADWINCDGAPELFMTQSPRPLVRWQNNLYEVEYDLVDHGPVVRIGDDFICVEQYEWVAN